MILFYKYIFWDTLYVYHVFAYSSISSKAPRHNGQIDSLAKLSECAVPEEDAMITSDAHCKYVFLVIYGDVAFPSKESKKQNLEGLDQWMKKAK